MQEGIMIFIELIGGLILCALVLASLKSIMNTRANERARNLNIT
jgi:hypothetical protein